MKVNLPCSQDSVIGPCPGPDESSSHSHSSSRSIFILFLHLRLRRPSDLLPSGFPTKNLYASPLLVSAICLAHLTFLDFIILTASGGKQKLWGSFLCLLLLPPGSEHLSTLFSNIRTLCSPVNARDIDSHAYKTTG